MKFPSIHSVVKGASQTFLRWPLVVLMAVVATSFCIRAVYLSDEDYDLHFWYRNVIASTYLGMMLSIALTVLAERRKFGRGIRVGLQGAALVVVVLYYFSLPDHFTTQAAIRFVLYALGLHWMIAVIAFSAGENNGFWVFNKKLFLRILTSVLYTTVLYIGLALALLAINQLFKVRIEGRLYTYIWFVLVGVFNTWFFLSGFPAGYESPAVIADYPRGLKIFTQFVLLPILTVYLLILYAYLFRIDKYTFSCHLDTAGLRLTLKPGKDPALVVDLSPVVTAAGFEQTLGAYNLPVGIMTLDGENDQWAVRLVLEHFSGILKNGKKRISSLRGDLLVRKK